MPFRLFFFFFRFVGNESKDYVRSIDKKGQGEQKYEQNGNYGPFEYKGEYLNEK